MICHICGKSEMAMRATHKECVDGLWKMIDEWKQEAERLKKEVRRLENVAKAYEIIINQWGSKDERDNT